MRCCSGGWSLRRIGLLGIGLFAVAAALFLALAPRNETVLAAPSAEDLLKDVLDRVPSDAGFFAHGRASDLWDTNLVKDVRKAGGKELEEALKSAESELGLNPEMLDTATFYFPQMPQGPGDEKTFVLAIITKKPYDKDRLLANLRKKDAKVKDNAVELQEDFVLHFTNDRTFAVMHKSLVKNYTNGPIANRKEGPVSNAIKLAAEKNHLVAGWNLGALPAELRTVLENQAETRPFSPLLKAKSLTLVGNVKQEIRLEARFANETANDATESERSLGLLMKLAQEGLEELLKDKRTMTELGSLMPALKEFEKGVKGTKVSREEKETRVTMTVKLDLPIAEMVTKTVENARKSAARAQAQNNLKQIGLALHNYHDVHNGFPPAAICDKKGKPLLSWRVAILPYIEQEALYKQFKLDEPWDSEHNKKLSETVVKVFMIPGVTKPGHTNYRVFFGNGAGFDLLQQTKLTDYLDGTSNTLVVVESAESIPWAKPDDFEFDPKADPTKLLLWQNDITNVLFGDGSVRALTKKVKPSVWKLLIQKNDGTPIPDLDE